MTTERGISIKEQHIIAKSSGNYISVKTRCLKFLDASTSLDASLDNVSTTLTSFPSLVAKGMENELFKKKLAYPYEKDQTIDSFYQPLKLFIEDYFSFLKQSYLDFEELKWTQATMVKKKVTNLKQLTLMYLKNDELLLTYAFR